MNSSGIMSNISKSLSFLFLGHVLWEMYTNRWMSLQTQNCVHLLKAQETFVFWTIKLSILCIATQRFLGATTFREWINSHKKKWCKIPCFGVIILYNNLRVYCSTKTAQRINLLKELFFALIFSHYLRDVRSDEYHLLNCSVVAATLHKTLYLSRGLKSAFNVWEGDHKRRMPAGTWGQNFMRPGELLLGMRDVTWNESMREYHFTEGFVECWQSTKTIWISPVSCLNAISKICRYKFHMCYIALY